jgi:hypothetical protein
MKIESQPFDFHGWGENPEATLALYAGTRFGWIASYGAM